MGDMFVLITALLTMENGVQIESYAVAWTETQCNQAIVRELQRSDDEERTLYLDGYKEMRCVPVMDYSRSKDEWVNLLYVPTP